MNKTCSSCRQLLSHENFYVDKSTYTGYRAYCKVCSEQASRCYREKNGEAIRIVHKAWRTRNRTKILQDTRRRKLVRDFGITPEEYEGLLAKQKGRCALCGGLEQVKGRRLAVDHDHTSGHVRGLLCGNCNKGLGHFQDSPIQLLKAVDYLKGPQVEDDYA